jgi:Type II CAAX prenyl endopeptidase Rce1-like
MNMHSRNLKWVLRPLQWSGAELLTLMTAFRAVVIVMGISALASLLNKFVTNSNISGWLLMHQMSFPGAVWAVEVITVFTYGAAVLLISYLVAKGYWWSLFPDRLRWTLLVVSLAAGVLFAMFLNNPMHVFLFDVFFDKPIMAGGAVSDSIVGGIFSGLRQSQNFLTMPILATMLVTPFIEELTDRGILFKEAEALPVWQILLLSFVVFCFSHYPIGGFAKVLAVAPVAALFVATRLVTGSFVYSAAAHIGVNAAALMKLQVW